MKTKSYFYSLVLLLAGAMCLSASCGGSDNGGEGGNGGEEEPLFVHTPSPNKVLILGIDGCLAAGINPTDMPNLHALLQESWAATNVLAEVPTWSATGWSGILTGTSVAKHKVVGNDFSGNRLSTYPTLFKYIKNEHPGWYTASIVQWGPINTYINKKAYFNKHVTLGNDQSVENSVLTELALDDAPEAMYVHFDDVDHAGHNYGFGLSIPQYSTQLGIADGRVGRILAAVKNRPAYSAENWLIMVVTDHGGTNAGGHGGASYVEQNAFIIINNKDVAPSLIDTPPTFTPRQIAADGNGNVVYENGVYATLPDYTEMPALDFGTDKSFTIEMLVKPSYFAAGYDPAFLANKDWNSGANPGIAMVARETGGDLKINLAGGGVRVDIDCAGIFGDKNAHFVSLVFDRTEGSAKVYVDGAFRTEKSVATMGSLTSIHPLRLGQDGTGEYGCTYRGTVSEVRIWSAALPAANIADYAGKVLADEAEHPASASLLIYNPGSFSGTTLAGGLGKPALPLTSGVDVDFNGAGYLYNIAPTVFSFLGLEAKPAYGWDGQALINFAD